MEIINGKMIVTEPQEFDIAKAQINDLESRSQSIQQIIQILTQKIVTHHQELDRTKTQVDILGNRYQQIDSGLQSLTQKQSTLNKDSRSWGTLQAETKALRTNNEQLSRQLTHQRSQQTILAIAAIPVFLASIVWTEVRFAKLYSGNLILQQQTP